MGQVTCDVAMSVDGFMAGPNQSLDNPIGEGIGQRLHGWLWAGAAADAAWVEAIIAADAFIMGRNMFGPVRGSWDTWDGEWRGWWGEEPPYHAPVFVLTHYPREPLVMEGGTTFHFVTDGIDSALSQARAAAGDGDISGWRRRRDHPGLSQCRPSSTSCDSTWPLRSSGLGSGSSTASLAYVSRRSSRSGPTQ